MFCRYCGKAIAEDSEFCTYCGKSLTGTATIEKAKTNSKIVSLFKTVGNFVLNNISLFVMTFGYIALGVFLIFNMKMSPFYGGWKFLAYLAEGAIAIALLVLTKRKIAECSLLPIQILSLVFSVLVIFSSISLRIVYDAKVDAAKKDIPNYGSVLIDIDRDTDYYAYSVGMVYDPHTSVKLDGKSDISKIDFGKPMQLEIECKGNGKKGTKSETITFSPSDFKNGEYTITKSVYIEGGLSATIEITFKRICTFWEVIFY